MNKMKAFTLTESLIMIAIVGVIATITMVSLAGLKPNKDKMLLQKAYKATMSAVAELTNDPVAYPPLKSAMKSYEFRIDKQAVLAVIMPKDDLRMRETCLRELDRDECETTPYIPTGPLQKVCLDDQGNRTTNCSNRQLTLEFTGDLFTDDLLDTGNSSNLDAVGGNTGISIGGSNNNGGFVLPDVGTASTGKTGNSSANVTITKASAALTDRSIPTRDTGKYTATNKFAYLFSNKIIANESVSSSSVSCSGATCTFRTNDGMSWTVTDGFSANNVNSTSTVVVDINGSKGPNKSYNPSKPTEVKTPDRFTFTIRANGQVVIASNDAVAVRYLSNRNYK